MPKLDFRPLCKDIELTSVDLRDAYFGSWEVIETDEAIDFVDELIYQNKDMILLDDIHYSISRCYNDYDNSVEFRIRIEGIVYNEDMPISKFKKRAIATEQGFISEGCESAECLRYNGNSLYTDRGYDVIIKLTAEVSL